MVRAGAIEHIVTAARAANGGGFGLRYVEVNGGQQVAGSVRFRAERVEHDPTLDCFGYVIEHAGGTLGYSGDTRLCDGVRRIATAADALVMDCSHSEAGSPVHMNLEDIRTLRAAFPTLPFVLTHLGSDSAGDVGISNVIVPDDLDCIVL
jgi:ribonuclease BN (tRNA processing enzyme)